MRVDVIVDDLATHAVDDLIDPIPTYCLIALHAD